MSQKTVTVSMPFSLWDEVIDGIAIDVERMTGENLYRQSAIWSATRRGRGWTYTAAISIEAGVYIARYLRSRVGLHVGYDEGKGAARRSEGAGARVARSVEQSVALADGQVP